MNFQSNRERREAVIRSSLVDQLKEIVKALIYGPGGENIPRLSANSPSPKVMGHNDNTNRLCAVIEAIFIHGLKDSLSAKLTSMFSDVDRMPVPNFWLVVMVICHRDLIEQVSALAFIMTDVGKSRAWIRLALNQDQLISYLSILAADAITLKDYYRPTAFLRDIECCDIMLKVFQPLTGLNFNLSTNSSMLNTWSQTPLILSGTWIPTKFESIEPVLSATDVVSTFIEPSSRSDLDLHYDALASDRMYEAIINGTPETNFIHDNIMDKRRDDVMAQGADEVHASGSKEPDVPKFKCLQDVDVEYQGRLRSPESLPSSEMSMDHSFSVESQNNDYKQMLLEWQISEEVLNPPLLFPAPVVPDQALEKETEQVSEDEKDFEMIDCSMVNEESSSFNSDLTVIVNERGLDHQGYVCSGPQCSVPVGMIYGSPRLCKFDGKYYCSECHDGDQRIIPSRVIHNWDFASYPVCRVHKNRLDELMLLPFVNIREMNPSLYLHVQDLAELQSLRYQLHFVQAYLFTCNSSHGQELRTMFWPREHLYEHVHKYSVQDLKDVNEGKLRPLVERAVALGLKHVVGSCKTCFYRGFVCEICKDKGIIFPFQIKNTFNCPSCSGVYHRKCLDSSTSCPKCQRIRIRKKSLKPSDSP